MLNKAQIIGHAGKDPEVRYLSNGDPVANVSIATTERWKDKNTGEQKEATEWHRITAYGKLAEIIGQYVKKGTLLYVEGKIKTKKWTDSNGQDKYATEIHCEQMKLLGGQQDAKPAASKTQAKPKTGNAVADLDSEIPW